MTVPYLTHTDRNRVCAHRPTNTHTRSAQQGIQSCGAPPRYPLATTSCRCRCWPSAYGACSVPNRWPTCRIDAAVSHGPAASPARSLAWGCGKPRRSGWRLLQANMVATPQHANCHEGKPANNLPFSTPTKKYRILQRKATPTRPNYRQNRFPANIYLETKPPCILGFKLEQCTRLLQAMLQMRRKETAALWSKGVCTQSTAPSRNPKQSDHTPVE